MIRDPMMPAAWYDQWIAYDQARIDKVMALRRQPAANAAYEPQYVYEGAGLHLHLLLRRYCWGDPVSELCAHLVRLLDAWEEAEVLGATVWTPEVQRSRHAWAGNLDLYMRCFWLTGLALALDLPQPQWQRLLKLMGNEGQDALLDRVIASRQPGRPIGTSLCHVKPYQRLLSTVTAAAQQRPSLLHDFVAHWRAELQRSPTKGLSPRAALHDQPYWYDHDKADGAYFGFWCLEAVAVAKAFDIDDCACLGTRTTRTACCALVDPAHTTRPLRPPCQQVPRQRLPAPKAGDLACASACSLRADNDRCAKLSANSSTQSTQSTPSLAHQGGHNQSQQQGGGRLGRIKLQDAWWLVAGGCWLVGQGHRQVVLAVGRKCSGAAFDGRAGATACKQLRPSARNRYSPGIRCACSCTGSGDFLRSLMFNISTPKENAIAK
jgi:Domain of unknown function (DUF1911)/Domain of unknown function (DUF1910)